MATLVGSVASPLHLYYTTNLAICQYLFEKFLKKFLEKGVGLEPTHEDLLRTKFTLP